MISRKLIVLLLMLILPLQGIAAAFAPLTMARMSNDGAAMPCHAHVAEGRGGKIDEATLQSVDHGSHHQAIQGSATGETSHNGPYESDSGAHACCHPVFSCAPGCVSAAPAQRFSDVPRFALTLATLYIPDSPDRPPRG